MCEILINLVPMNRIILRVTLWAGCALTQGCATVGAPAPSPTDPLPPIHSAGDAAFGKPPTRKISLDQVVQEIRQVDQNGSWLLNKQWEIIINSLVASEIPTVLDAVEKMRALGPQTMLRNAFFSRWAETDPAAAMARALAIQNDVLRATARRSVLQGWIYANPKEVLKWMSQLPEGALRTEIGTMVVGYALTNDPSAVVGIMRNADGTTASVGISVGSSGTSAGPTAPPEQDLQAQIIQASKLAGEIERNSAYSKVGMTWAQRDPVAAVKWARSLTEGSERNIVSVNTLMAWARRAPAEANQYLFAEPKSEWRRSMFLDVFRVWGERDLDGAVAWAQKVGESELRLYLLGLVVESWVKKDPDAVAEYALALPVGTSLNSAVEKLVARWSTTNPQALGNFLRRATPEQRASHAFNYALSNWIQSAPEDALAFVLTSMSGSQRQELAIRALAAVAKRDLTETKKKIESLPDGPEKTQLVRGAITATASENPEFALWLFARLPPNAAQWETTSAIAQVLARSDPVKALAWAKSLPNGPAKLSPLQAALRRMAETDPGKALAETLSLPPNQARNEMVGEVVGRIAQTDPARAAREVAAIEDVALRLVAIRPLVSVLGRSDPDAAVKVVMTLPVSEARGGLLTELMQNWAQLDVNGPIRWAEMQTSPIIKALALGAAVQALANYAPAEAATLLDRIPVADRLERATSLVCDYWSRNDPAGAARWAAGLPTGSVRTLALPRVVTVLARADFAAGGAWLERLPAGPDRDRTIQSFLGVAATDHAPELKDWPAKIGDQETRFVAIETIGRHWLRADVEAANRWLAATDLPAERRTKLRPASPIEFYR